MTPPAPAIVSVLGVLYGCTADTLAVPPLPRLSTPRPLNAPEFVIATVPAFTFMLPAKLLDAARVRMLVPAVVNVRLLGPLIDPANVATLFTVSVLLALT